MGSYYYTHFDAVVEEVAGKTGGTNLFDTDLSEIADLPSVGLLPVESSARSAWNSAREALDAHFGSLPAREVTSSEQLLGERVAPPGLVADRPSTRCFSKDRTPMNPERLCVWDGFTVAVSRFHPSNPQACGGRKFDVFNVCLASTMEAREETDEQRYLIDRVLWPLRGCGLIDYPASQKAEHHGVTDVILTQTANEDTICCMVAEFKSTHRLTLPMLATEVVLAHNTGHADGTGNNALVKERICDPIGQLLRYLVVNGLRFGALTSATRTYFFRIEDEGDAVGGRVCVSDAFFLGQQDYLRAWAYCYSLSTQATVYDPDMVSWAGSHVEYVDDGDDDSDDDGDDGDRPKQQQKAAKKNPGDSPNTSGQTGQYAVASVLIPSVPFASLSIGKALGYGRNGCVFHADWRGKTVAVKQFDLGRPGVYTRFKNEISAYERLKNAQGILVPKALFLTQSKFGIAYLGLELGRIPVVDDDVSNWGQIIKRLRTEYGFCHRDAGGSNGIFIKDGRGGERLVAIDLEQYELADTNRKL